MRHGQAGTRDSYDSLSDLGRRQSRLLGEYFASQGIEFTAAFSGALSRQQQTAAEISAAYAAAGVKFPEIITDHNWNEFDLTRVYQEIGPLLCEEDDDFRREYGELRRQIKESDGSHSAEVHRRWWPADTRIIETWVAGRFASKEETWIQFRERISNCITKFNDAPQQANILVSTSATPTGILTGLALDCSDQRIRYLAGALYNSSYTMLRQRAEHLYLFQFNAVPHLITPELRTHR